MLPYFCTLIPHFKLTITLHPFAQGLRFCRILLCVRGDWITYYNDVIMSAMASQITSLTIVSSVVYSGADHRKHRSSASLAFVWGNSPVTGEFPAQRAGNAENTSIFITSSCTHRDTGSRRDDVNFAVSGATVGCQNDNKRCHQWRQIWYHDNFWFTVKSNRESL